ncbi:MAG: segregation/condensation protein A [Proteobacteria bacterium]|nr:segregation/condensation protein A [Pseudomonadota bacterium]
MQPLSSLDDRALRIELPSFEGPLDLLLHLIRKHELDILDLPIAFVTERYLDYLGLMRELNLDVASEYLLMAATLAHIKSRMLLPVSPADQQDDESPDDEQDPRAELIRRLLEYQKYKAAAQQLGSRPISGRDVFARCDRASEFRGAARLAEVDVFVLLDAFERVAKRASGRLALEVTPERISLQERMTQLTDLIRERGRCEFDKLFEGIAGRYDIVVSFLAVLEMVRLHLLRVYQSGIGATLYVQSALLAGIAEAEETSGSVIDLETNRG